MPTVSAWTVTIGVGAAVLLATMVDGNPKAPPAAAPAASIQAGGNVQTDAVAFVDKTFPATSAGANWKVPAVVFIKNSTGQKVCVSLTAVLRTASGTQIERVVQLKESTIEPS